MRVVIDTNVFISATFWYGDSDKILEKIDNKEIKLVLSRKIIEEFSRVLNSDEIKKKIEVKDLQLKHTIHKILSIAELVKPTKRILAVKDDPDDDKFIEAAVEGECDYIISKDKHLWKIGEYKGIRILKPADFLKIL